METKKQNHDDAAKRTIARLNDAGAYMVVANFGGNIEVAFRGPIEAHLLMMKIADLYITNAMNADFKKD